MKQLFVFTAFMLGIAWTAPAQETPSLKENLSKLRSAKTKTAQAGALLDVGTFFLMKPGETANDMKAARAYLEAATKLAKPLNSTDLNGDILFFASQISKESGDKITGLKQLDGSINLYKSAGSEKKEGIALMEKRHYYELSGNQLTERIAVVKKALKAFEHIKDKRLQGDAFQELGDLYGNDGKTIECINYLKRAIQLYRQANFKRTQGLYSLLGIAYTSIGNYEQGLRYGLDAERVAISVGDSTVNLCTIYNRIGMAYDYLHEPQKAIEFYRKALSNAMSNDYQEGVIYLTNNLINVLVDNHKYITKTLPDLDNMLTKNSKSIMPIIFSEMSRTYLLVNNPGRAKYFLDRLVAYGSAHELIDLEKVYLYTALFEYNFYLKDYKEAREIIEKEQKILPRLQNTRHMRVMYQGLYRLDSAQGNFEAAFENHKRFKTYTDSSLINKARNEVQMLTVRFDMDKKDEELQRRSENIQLLTRDNQNKRELLNREYMIRYISILAIVALILLLVTLYSRWKTNKRNSAIIEIKNLHLQQLVGEKELLVKEIHHRVKNNLQTIISLLESQASYLTNEALEAVLDSQHRVHAMSIIHQKLYLVENGTSIDMQSYIRELLHYLSESFAIRARLSIVTEIDPLDLDVSKAIPVGLILNEAITNAMKYAFPNNRYGQIAISLKTIYDDLVLLKVSDDGIGLPSDLNRLAPKSLGMTLMHGLSREISGQLEITGNAGTEISLKFERSELDESIGIVISQASSRIV
jgi:two-component sensor histidine kinase